jgi:hypothetical protein
MFFVVVQTFGCWTSDRVLHLSCKLFNKRISMFRKATLYQSMTRAETEWVYISIVLVLVSMVKRLISTDIFV